ncbi:MAG: glycosyltransferase family 2 protein [Pirellulaceae bacterium]
MLFWPAIILFLLMATSHVLGARVFRHWLRGQDERLAGMETVPSAVKFTPTVAVILSVRGMDPFLGRTIEALLNQSYDAFHIHVIVDGVLEPVQAICRSSKKGASNITWHQLESPSLSCGLKCSALLQVLGTLDKTIEVIALIDADVVPHETWLADLIRPLSDERVGAVTGTMVRASASTNISQWMGSAIRALWNAGSIVPTSMVKNPWAGTLAIRRTDLDSANLQELWSKSIVDDGPIKKSMHGIGQRVEFVPSLIAINRETCSISFVVQYVTRMLTWSRWYEASFWNTAVHAAFMLIAWAILGLAISFAVWGGRYGESLILVGALATGILEYISAFYIVRNSIHRMLRRQSLSVNGFLRHSIFRVSAAAFLIVLTQVVFFTGVIRALCSRRIRWRGIEYEVRGPYQVTMTGYRPHAEQTPGTDSL